ncbi:MAG: 16S rRNA (uracil(1498)-N(3))-methyltransferase [Cephaloticoccus sp.]
MNLILFQSDETQRPLPRDDARAVHLLTVLRRQPGDTFDAGLINGPRGKGTVVAIGSAHLELSFNWSGAPPPPVDPVTLVLGLPRPQTARKILQEAAALGVTTLHFVRCDRAEPSYADSTLWSSGEWQRHLEAGTAQAFATDLPTLTHGETLVSTLANLPADATRLALDNYESSAALSAAPCPAGRPLVLAFGPERGWSPAERDALRARGFTLAHLGTRVLRLETAVVAALAITKARRGLM